MPFDSAGFVVPYETAASFCSAHPLAKRLASLLDSRMSSEIALAPLGTHLSLSNDGNQRITATQNLEKGQL